MILNDLTIRRLSTDASATYPLIAPFREEQLNPASYDVTLGDIIKVAEFNPDWFMNPKVKPTFKTISIQNATEENPYLIEPGICFLASTQEVFNLPDNLSSMFVLKSSRAREFYNHMFAGFGDPGWENSTYTLELKNENRSAFLPVWPGLKIGQVIFMETMSVGKSYAKTGHYNGQTSPRESWSWETSINK